MKHLALLALILLPSVPGLAGSTANPLDGPPGAIERPITYAEMEALLDEVDRLDHVHVASVGRSLEGRELYVVRIAHADHAIRPEDYPWRLYFVGQQHGNEVAGKDALLFLIRDLARDISALPPDTALWIVPMSNPDGAEAGLRRNAADADLNRDHLGLTQPEARAIHAVARRVRPHISVDCHEFTRDSGDYRERGWEEWPLIMMDTANHPLLPMPVYEVGKRWVESAVPVMEAAGYNYVRYRVGGLPPHQEMRWSTLDADDARNGLAFHGGLSFIIESGVKRSAENPHADLDQRVGAYLTLLRRFIDPPAGLRAASIGAVAEADATPLPDFLPTNFFWGSHHPQVSHVRVIEQDTGEVRAIPTANFMRDRIVKRSVTTPTGYAIPTGPAAEAYADLLDAFGLGYATLREPRTLRVEPATLVRVEEDYDELYNRYDGRQIVMLGKPVEKTFEVGSLWIRLDRPGQRRAPVVLEPSMLYGLFQFAPWRALVPESGSIPVYRIVE